MDLDLRKLVVLQGEEVTPELSLCLMKIQREGSCMRVRKRALTEPDHAGTLVWTSRFQNGVHPDYGIFVRAAKLTRELREREKEEEKEKAIITVRLYSKQHYIKMALDNNKGCNTMQFNMMNKLMEEIQSTGNRNRNA